MVEVHRAPDRTEEDAERVRMALAEIGYGHVGVHLRHSIHSNRMRVFISGRAPAEVRWRATQTAGLHGACLACVMHALENETFVIEWGCDMYGVPFAEDCGADRPGAGS